MRNNRFQNHVSESTVTLPLCMVIGALAWFWNGNNQEFDYSHSAIISLALAAISTYIVIETSNVFALLRIRSSMIATVWVVCISLTPYIHTFSEAWIAVPALAGSYYVMFLTYQQHEPVIHVFHTFVLLGIASLAIPQLLVFVPLYYWYLLVFLRSLTWRGLWAGLVGLILPMCFVLGWSIVSDNYSLLWSWTEGLLNTDLFNAGNYAWMLSYKEPEALGFALLTLTALISIVHYLRNYYNDKIRTRMFLYIYVMQTAITWLLVVAMPDMYSLLAPVLMLSASTMIAHFFALTGTIVSNLFFCLTLLLTLMLFTLNLGIWTF